jgi:hypothetical protein
MAGVRLSLMRVLAAVVQVAPVEMGAREPLAQLLTADQQTAEW